MLVCGRGGRVVAGGPVARGDRAAHSGAGPRDRAAEAREGGHRAGARSAARRAGPARARAGPVARRAGDRPARCQATGGAVLQTRADADPATARSQTRPSLRAARLAARARAHRRGRGGAAARGVSHLWRRGGHRASRRAVPGRPAARAAARHSVPPFHLHVGRCRRCGRRVHGRDRRQTPTATGAAASQVGPRALAWAAWLHTALGVPFAKVAMILRTGCGLTIYGGVVVRDGWAPYRKLPHATHQTGLALTEQGPDHVRDERGEGSYRCLADGARPGTWAAVRAGGQGRADSPASAHGRVGVRPLGLPRQTGWRAALQPARPAPVVPLGPARQTARTSPWSRPWRGTRTRRRGPGTTGAESGRSSGPRGC